MVNPSDRPNRHAKPLRLGLLLLAFGLLLPAFAARGAWAQRAAEPIPNSAEARELRDAIEGDYEVLPLRDGVVLRPREAMPGVRTIEVTGDSVAVDGQRVASVTLREWLGEDVAGPILELQELSPRERRALFGFDGSARPEALPEDDSEPGILEEEEVEPADADFPEVPEPPRPPRVERAPSWSSGERVKVGGGIDVKADELAESVVAIGGSVRVDGEVDRDVVAIGGSVRITGRVGGEVVAVGGSVILGPDAVVDGAVTSVGGGIQKAAGAEIHGPVSEVKIVPWVWGGDWDWDWQPDRGDRMFGPWPFLWGGRVAGEVLGLLVLALLVSLVILVARAPLERVDRHVANQPWKAGLVGLAAQLLFLPLLLVVTILLAITIVGCALFLLYPFLFLALLLLALLGYAAVAYRLGRWVEGRFGLRLASPYVAALVGVLAIEGWSLLGHFIAIGSGPLDVIAFFILMFGALVSYVAWTVGFGAMLLARFGAAPGHWGGYGAAGPPLPPPPPPPTPERMESPAVEPAPPPPHEPER
jgi:hypothetical protein